LTPSPTKALRIVSGSWLAQVWLYAVPITEEEAKARCAELAAEHPDRVTNQWIPVHSKDGSWAVARIGLAPPAKPTGTSSLSEPRPAADDPRESFPWLNPQSGGF
jgi:hypothetical protein